MRMMRDQQLDALAIVFKALADRTRLRILGLLAAGEVCVCNLHESLGLPQPTTSRHLAYLRRAGLVTTRKEGLWVHYRLAEASDPVMEQVVESVRHAVGHLGAAGRDRRRLARRQPSISRDTPGGCCEVSSEGTARRPCCVPR